MNFYTFIGEKKNLRFIFTICLLLLANLSIVIGQNNFNKLDSLGRKHGYWKVFLDENFNPSDSSNSYYYAYSYFDEGKPIVFYKKPIACKNGSYNYTGQKGVKGHPIAADGSFTRTCRRRSEKASFENGFLKRHEDTVGLRSGGSKYTYKSIANLDKKYYGIEGSYFIENFDDSGNLTSSSYYAKKNGKWKFIEVK